MSILDSENPNGTARAAGPEALRSEGVNTMNNSEHGIKQFQAEVATTFETLQFNRELPSWSIQSFRSHNPYLL